MADFCLDCLNKLDNTNHSAKRFILSDYADLCEGCGCYKRIVIMERKYYYLRKFRYVLLPFRIIDFLIKVLALPYFIFIRIKYGEGKK